MYTEIQLSRLRLAELRAEADAHRLAAEARPPVQLRARVGWTLVGLGLRLATTGPAPAAV
ncbi:hypothetical protein NX794_14985 [Streptomyces sp. LP11]|uniref:Uncharacterized protein n=1 Tax=Streptomyces pyxinicus TaxID=2970331 RepID=A0ABT2B3J4_9ACTN|nr:hypothetical protein [Streptomyces sp. LP11]MCS0602508.1 hypothetical protein [Streptomyces sp. LP11]